MVSRDVILSLDPLERKVTFGLAGVGLALAAVFLLVQQHGITTEKPKNGHCSVGFTLVKGVCNKSYPLHFADFAPQFFAVLVGAVALAFFAWRKKRAGAVVIGGMMGLFLGNAGLPFLATAVWFVVRALRLQKYGTASFVGTNQVARQRAIELNAAKKSGKTAGASTSTAPDARKPPAPNKRYTPKQSGRRR